MVKLNLNCMSLSRCSDKPYMMLVSFPYREGVINDLRPFPGARYAPEYGKSKWLVPAELQPQVLEIARAHGLAVSPLSGWSCAAGDSPIFKFNPKLYDYQHKAVLAALDAQSWMLNFEMGLGKTPSAIEAMRARVIERALIICPAMVRLNWRDELDRWWPEHPEVAIVDSRRAADKLTHVPIRIVSYELAGAIPTGGLGAFEDAIVVDESHYLSNNRSGRSKVVRAILDANPHALRLSLTATPITNEPKGLWHQLDALWPGRFGSWAKFMKRYTNVTENAYTKWNIQGLNEEHADELRQRVAACSSRVTKAEVAHLLPPFCVQTVRVKPQGRGFNPKEMLEKFSVMDLHRNNGEELIRAAGEQKVEAALEHARTAAESTSHVCILTHLKITAHEIATALSKEGGREVVLVDGDVPIKARMAQIEAARKLKSCFLVATMHSVNVGIDLTAFPVAIFAELDYTPANIIQALGRFSRLSGKVPSTVLLLVLEGTQDEIVASRVLKKIADTNAVVRAGLTEAKMEQALRPDIDEESFFAELRAAAQTMIQEEFV